MCIHTCIHFSKEYFKTNTNAIWCQLWLNNLHNSTFSPVIEKTQTIKINHNVVFLWKNYHCDFYHDNAKFSMYSLLVFLSKNFLVFTLIGREVQLWCSTRTTLINLTAWSSVQLTCDFGFLETYNVSIQRIK